MKRSNLLAAACALIAALNASSPAWSHGHTLMVGYVATHGTNPHAAAFDAVHAAYRGIGPAITDLLGGQTQMMMPGLAVALPHIKAGKMTPIAVTGVRRHPLLPDVPTFEELRAATDVLGLTAAARP